MNQRDTLKERLKITTMFKQGTKLNVVHLNAGSGWLHEISKCLICFYLLKVKKVDFVTEAEFKDKSLGRCDVVQVTLPARAFEVVDTETEESLIRKEKKYPLPITIVRVIPFRMDIVLEFLRKKTNE